MTATELSPLQAKKALEAAFSVGTKVALRGAEFLECFDKGSNKFVGILTIELYQPSTGRRSVGVLRVYGPRQSLEYYAISYDSGQPVTMNMEQLVPGIVSLEDTPLRIGGMAICCCGIDEPAAIAYDCVSPYGQDYLHQKSKKGYRLPSFQVGGRTSAFLLSMEDTFSLGPMTAEVKWTIPGPNKMKPDAKAKAPKALNPSTPPKPQPLTDSANIFFGPRKRLNIQKPN